MEDNDGYRSPLDELFDRLERRNPEHIALKYYRGYRSGSGKTLKSIQITLISRLEKFNLDSLAGITQYDEMELWRIGERKTAVFGVIPDNDSSFNFIIGMLYTQLFQQLYYQADVVHGGRLPVHVHFVMDEFANVALPDDFDKLLSTMRSREISVSIILQNLAQLKALFEKQWESIMGNCDELLYLGGNEQSTHEYISKLLGKATIHGTTHGATKGHSGSFSTTQHLFGRELMTPDEVRMLDNRKALLFIRGERPILDDKYDLLKHPNLHMLADGGAPVYDHGADKYSYAGIAIDLDAVERAVAEQISLDHLELLSEEELQTRILNTTEESSHEQE
jgi:type IV secretion system protein VirD4